MSQTTSGRWTGVLALVLSLLAMLALSAVVWWIGPLIAVADVAPLQPVVARIALIALLWLIWIARLAWKAWRRRRSNAALLEGISAPSASDQEAKVLAQRFREAVAKLRASRGKRSMFGSSDSLYDMPWYVFVGAPGSGKTTALLNAGLQFVLADDGAAVKGVGGTRNCDWWFTRDAVLIDTAGRYALQESDKSVDASAWNNFLMLLCKTRPRRPINGVLLTVSVQDLLQRGALERTDHAAKLRARLDELQTKLGVRPPVYVMVTKADLVAGFAETFDALGKSERDQVWGFTFDARADAGPEALTRFVPEFKALVERLSSGLNDRLQSERDPLRRAAMFGFVQEFASLQAVLHDFLGQVFGSAGKLQDTVRLRGVYLTSGTQEGTPIDRVMGQLSRSFGLERKLPVASGQRGKSFFLRQLLQDVVFREAHLVSANPEAERRRFAVRMTGFAAVAVLTTVMAVGWAVSYTRNKAYEEDVASRVPGLRKSVDGLPPVSNSDPSSIAGTLGAVRDAAKPEGFPIDSPPLLNTLGLYQGDRLDAGAQQAYRKLLDHALLPRIATRLEERLRGVNKDNLEQAYAALKAYVMLYTADKFDPVTLKAWIAIDWDTQFRNLSPEQRADLDRHLDAVLAQGAPQSLPKMDPSLVGSVREMLASFPLEYRIYGQLQRQFRGDLPEFTVAGAAGPDSPKVFERVSREPLSRGVSGFYTRDGYVKAFQGSVAQTATRLASEEQWVLGRGRSAADIAKLAVGTELSDRVRRLYLQDYVKVWDRFLDDVRLVRLGDIDRSIDVARLLSGADSPMTAYLRAVNRETTLIPQAGNTGALGSTLGGAVDAARKAKDDMAKLADPQPAPNVGAGPIERIVDDHFAAIHKLFQGQPAPIDELPKKFGDVYAQLQAISAAQKSKTAPPPMSGSTTRDAGMQPEPVRSMLENLADAGAKQGRAAERDSMTGDLKPIFDFCSKAIANRYPFSASSRADALPEDFGQLFGVGGMLDDFYQKRLASLVDTGGATWVYKPAADGARPAAPTALADFQRASRIKEVFFRNGGRMPSFRVDIRLVELAPTLDGLTFDIDGQVSKFESTNSPPITVSWPGPRVSSLIKLSTASGVGTQVFEGPWALFRLFDRYEIQSMGQPEKFAVIVNVDNKRARLEVTANSVYNPFRMREMQQFRCPGAL